MAARTNTESWFSILFDSLRDGNLDASKPLILQKIQQQFGCDYAEAHNRFQQALHVMDA